MQNNGNFIIKNSLLLGAMAGVCVGISAGIYLLTKDSIDKQLTTYKQQLFSQVISAQYYENNLLQTCHKPQGKFANLRNNPVNIQEICEAKKNGETSAYVFETVTNEGYNGKITLLVAVTLQGEVLGVRVIQHNETPSLGDKIDLKKSPWILSFAHKILDSNNLANWAVKKDGGDFDQFTGATITPRAVVNQVKIATSALLNILNPKGIEHE